MFLEVKVCRVDSFDVERTALELRYRCLDNAHGSSSCCNGDKEVGSQSSTESELPVFYRDDRDGVSSTERSNLSIAETMASKAKTRHRSKIEATRVALVKEQKDKILKLGRTLTFNNYNLCPKKMAESYPEVDTDLLDQIEISDDGSEEYEDDKDPDDSPAS
ncbi:hypothetical protein F0562_013544 [Nyssa sinensis]|uniref:Uncharacterized protein n=1 Tax=Nyssa sinensis TaxID=561372 RepID=A0A5J4ZNQ5_9ASTE|nr:hypothetical protein F0562_013544 [Nyssa sinensis]